MIGVFVTFYLKLIYLEMMQLQMDPRNDLFKFSVVVYLIKHAEVHYELLILKCALFCPFRIVA